ncbi:MAG: CPBP family intramembrane metalloprotease [Planctomycetota bacterium]|nr:MAG: CPBP family intramembrane metalloprotease [Planctomycetota bacterium]
MSQSRRIGAIYRKELTDILRDRRTLIAMIVIPVVLYPLLMIGFMRAAEGDEARIRAQQFIIEVDNEPTRSELEQVLSQYSQDMLKQGEQGPKFKVLVGHTSGEELGDEVQLRVVLGQEDTDSYLLRRRVVRIMYNEVNVFSRTAMQELSGVFDRIGEFLMRQYLRDNLGDTISGVPAERGIELILEPIVVDTKSTATELQRGGWALGQIVPFILVLLTITGAVYPAIDLTAGERERGTLETLMAAPVPILQLIVGKFLVVATIGMFVAALNVVSVGATMHFSGLTQAITSELPTRLPASALLIILFCMIPFALLFSAILVAVCSFARTFKEAQNYVMPVIIGAMIPAMVVVMPSIRLEGIMLVVPVANMVLLVRDLFQQTATWTMVIVVLLSTTLYAIAAVAVAARLFGQEAVLFADAGSYKTLFRRSLFPPLERPSISQALLLAALLFPASFYAQSLVSGVSQDNFVGAMSLFALVQFFLMFMLLPLCLAGYLKIDVVRTFRLRWPGKARIWLAVLLLGTSSWVVAHQFLLLQSEYITPSKALAESLETLEAKLAEQSLWVILLLLAVVPAVAEEWLFRGFFLSGTASSLKKWSAIIMVSVIFGIYHFLIDHILVKALLGVLLAYLCWQTRSLLPGIIVHIMHNGWVLILSRYPDLASRVGLPEDSNVAQAHLPSHIQIPAFIIFVLGVIILMTIRDHKTSLVPEGGSG